MFAVNLLVLIATPRAGIAWLFFTAIMFGMALGITLCASIVVGLPTALLLRKRSLETKAMFIVTGAVFGAVIALILVPVVLGAKDITISYSIFIPLCAVSGSVTAWTWWRSPQA
jgi:hypothetical protein